MCCCSMNPIKVLHNKQCNVFSAQKKNFEIQQQQQQRRRAKCVTTTTARGGGRERERDGEREGDRLLLLRHMKAAKFQLYIYSI